MCGCASLIWLFTVLATPTAAQATAEDGIRAFLRGDYPAAARILRPLVEDPVSPDPAAEFFLALLHETGQGVRRDQERACGLFLRAASRAHPFAQQSAAIAASMRQELGAAASRLCVANERWQGGPPQSFVLGPEHRIVFADTSITVTYGDQQQRTHLLPPIGVVFLPIRYTTLSVTRPVVAHRHFFESFAWIPDTTANPSSWKLHWILSEVVGHRWILITSEASLVVLEGSSPPASFDATHLVRLHAGRTGDAELTIAGGSSPRTEVIPWQPSR